MAAFKDQVSPASIAELGEVVVGVWAPFERNRFVAVATDGIEALELMARVDQVARALWATLPASFSEAASVVAKVARAEGLAGWAALGVNRYVALAGIDHPDLALPLLAALTSRGSSEFAIRPFIERHPAHTFEVLSRWVSDPDEHVRRLVSEGTRPRLPWGGVLRALVVDPSPSIALLERLVDDESAYVRRSVANHLGDIAKDHPALAVDLAHRWRSRPHGDWVVRHGLRLLVKRGDPGALAVLGFSHVHQVRLVSLEVEPTVVPIGGAVVLRAVLEADESTDAVIDYVVHYQGAKGRKAGKVFKAVTRRIEPGEALRIERRHRFEHVSIRRIVPGPHRVEVQVNGQVLGGVEIEVVEATDA